ncbi:hypothetical protein LUR56_31220 [Streptomyces sp. MT29]|nr:hypothetical protein [Streptomyces sp. MT29]
MDTSDGSDPAPFTEPRFSHFAGAGDIDCSPTNPLEAECTDADGTVMSSKAATGPDSTIFSFSYGDEQIGLRIFYDTEYADTWARQKGTQELYPNLVQHGRYVLWGTDLVRIKEYGDLLDQADGTGGATALGQSTPLPPRLAALTLGTLGVDEHQVNRLIAAPAAMADEAPTMLAARMILGIDTAPAPFSPGDDIVAIAAGIEPNAPKTPVAPPAVMVPVTDPAPSTGGGTPAPPPAVTPPSPRPTAPPETAPADPPVSPPEAKPTGTVPPPVTVEPPPPVPVEPVPPAPVELPPPVEPVTPLPPTEEQPPAPVDPVPVPEPTEPAEGTEPPEEEGQDDVLILDSAWTVAA